MGMSIDIHVFDKSKVVDMFHIITPHQDEIDLLKKAMEEFGVVHENTWVLQSADAWDGYSPWSEFISLIERLCQRTDGYELLEKCQVGWKYQGENAEEWYAGETDKDLPEHPDDE